MPSAHSATPRIRFSAADELSCYFDAPAEPCNIHLEIQVPGHLNPAELRQATCAALAAQPLAMVRRARARWWQSGHEWEQPQRTDVDPVAVTAWADEDELSRLRAAFLSTSPPVSSSPPVRILLATGPGEDRIILNAHHAAMDGISCAELLLGIARHYPAAAGAVAPPPTPARPAGAAPAPDHGRPDRAAGRRAAQAPAAGRRAGPAPAALRLASALPKPTTRIAGDRQGVDGRGSRAGYGVRLLRLPVPAAPGQWRREPGQPRPTVNDLLIAAMVVAIGRWNSDHGRPSGRIRITMPVNARLPGHAATRGNLSRLTAVTAPPSAGDRDLAGLVSEIAAQTRWAKDHTGPQVDPLSGALARAWCPAAGKRWLLRLALRTAGPLLCDTSLVTNLGLLARLPRFGAAEATGMWVSAPAHMPRGLSVGAIGVGGQLYLCLRYRRALFSEPAASGFAHVYAAALSDLSGAVLNTQAPGVVAPQPTDAGGREIASQGSPA